MSFHGSSAPATTRSGQLFALRPLEIKQLFDFTFRVYRANFAPMFLTMAVAQFPISMLASFLTFKLLQLSTDLSAIDTTGAAPDFSFFMKYVDDLLPLGLYALATAVYYLLALPLAYLACSKLVLQALINDPWNLGQALHFARQRYWPTQGAMFLFALPVLLLALLLLLPVLAFSQGGDDTATLIAAVVALLLIWFGALATWLLWFRLFPALIGAVQSMEAAPPGTLLGQALWYLRRSYDLTRGHFWRMVGLVILYTTAVYFFQNGMYQTISNVAQAVHLGRAFQQGSENAIKLLEQNPPAETMVVSLVLYGALSLFFPAMQIAYLALLYLDLRIRKEGLDLELAMGTAQIDS